MTSCPLVMIEWEDSAQPSPNWRHLQDAGTPTPIVCRSVGWLIVDTARVKVIAPNMGAIDDPTSIQMSGTITIPTRCVRRTVRLKEPKIR